jgi:hypothetical protein
MIPKTVIEKAIEGGWQPNFSAERYWPPSAIEAILVKPKFKWRLIALDPTFWQALGKALGGKNWTQKEYIDEREVEAWFANAINFYWLILTNGDTDKFWNELLSDMPQ